MLLIYEILVVEAVRYVGKKTGELLENTKKLRSVLRLARF